MSPYRIILTLVLSSLGATAGDNALSVDFPVPPGTLHGHQLAAASDAADEGEAARRFVAHLDAVIAGSIVPGVRRGILAKSTARPPALRVEVTEDPSPYHVGASADPDGTLRVHLSLGYVTMHDAALDAVALSASFHRPAQLMSYLFYQLALARENERRQASGNSRYRAMSFAQFAHLDDKATAALFSQDSFKRERAQIEVSSLGWVVAYLLARLDPRLAGESPSVLVGDGHAASVLAASSGWFPVPPLATALGLAEVVPAASQSAAGSQICRAAALMEEGVQVLKSSQPWSTRMERDSALQHEVVVIESDILSMRRDGDCKLAIAAAL